jgi:hypothetical protein
MRRTIALLIVLALPHAPAALAQGVPPILIPAPPAPTMPPLVAPAPVPSVVTPLPSPRYGVPAGVTQAPLYGSGIAPSVRYRAPIKHQKPKRRPRVSSN